MIAMTNLISRLVRNRDGSVAIEFAILGPTVIALMLGILQIGLGMQALNAMRSISAETARFAAVEYQKDNTPGNTAIRTQAIAIATASPFNLDGNALQVTIQDAGTQRVSGAREISLSLAYTVPTVLPFMGWASPTMTHARPIFVID